MKAVNLIGRAEINKVFEVTAVGKDCVFRHTGFGGKIGEKIIDEPAERKGLQLFIDSLQLDGRHIAVTSYKASTFNRLK